VTQQKFNKNTTAGYKNIHSAFTKKV